MQILEGKLARIITVGLVGGLASLLIPRQITDSSYEALLVGAQWFENHAIPLVQSYSHYAPLSLLLAHLWQLVAPDSFSGALLDFLIGVITTLLFWKISGYYKTDDKVRVSLLGLFLASMVGAGVFERGPAPGKLAIMMLLATITCMLQWHRSKPSYWFMGRTDKNWRYLLVSGLCFAGLAFTEYLYFIVAVPFVVHALYMASKTTAKRLSASAFFVLPLLGHTWVWISYFDSRNLMGQWVETIRLHFDYLLHDTTDRLGLLVFIPLVTSFCFALYHARRTNYKTMPDTWLLAIACILLCALLPKLTIVISPLLLLFTVYWADRKSVNSLGKTTIEYAGFASALLIVLLTLAVNRSVRIETAKTDLAQAYIEQRLVDTSHVLYYGRGAGFYNSLISPSTSFVDSKAFAYDRAELGLVDRLRGENEASSPRFVLVGKDTLAVNDNPRINDYIETHYEKTAELDGFDIYKRK